MGWSPPEQAVWLFGSSKPIGVITIDVVPIESGWTWERPLTECARIAERVLRHFMIDRRFDRRTFIGVCENTFSERVSAYKRFWRRLRLEQPHLFVEGEPLANADLARDFSMVQSKACFEVKSPGWDQVYYGVADVSTADPAALSRLLHLRGAFSWAVMLSVDDADAAVLNADMCACSMAVYGRGKLGALDPRLLGDTLSGGRRVLFSTALTEHRGEALARVVFACDQELVPMAHEIGLDSHKRHE